MRFEGLSRPIEILMIDDNPGDVRLTQEALRASKVETNLHVASEGIAAMDFLFRRDSFADAPRPDIIFLDLNLPGKDGREILAEIKADDGLKAIPVAVLTSSSAPADIEASYEGYANCYITKPSDFESFKDVVRMIDDFWFTAAALPSR